MPDPALQSKARKVYGALKRAHPEARIELRFRTPLELLVATLLSAQCTDARVNQVTANLFRKYKTPEDYLNRPLSELEQDIRATGFYRRKAKSLRGVMQALAAEYQGQVPADLDALTRLPGIGRKTANVILGNAFGAPGIVVDTHVSRVSGRIGLTSETKPDRIEAALSGLYPRSEWVRLSHVLIFHGRYICKARRPLCAECTVSAFCDYFSR